MTPKKTTKFDLYQQVTDQIVAAIEQGMVTGKEWRRPWHTTALAAFSPINSISRRAYRGINTVCLWAAAQAKGFTSGEWGTYKQWADKGAQVRRGEKSTLVVFWKFGVHDEASEKAGDKWCFTRGYHVFNACQVEGYVPPAVPERIEPERHAAADAFFTAIGADVRHGGNSAHYLPAFDLIQLPHVADFDSAHDYYSVSAHEHTHWTGSPKRCARDLSGRFKSMSYAAEELVAELGAAFVCAQLGL